jgi:2,4-dienoyl-CoA reductase (NADPH2)
MLVDWLESECRELGVDLQTEREADADELAGLDPAELENVVIATGARPGDRDYSVTAAARVVTAATALDDPDGLPDGTVLVWDPIGGPIGVSVAELLAAAGRTVGIATPDYIVGNELARSGDLAPANARLAQAGVEMHKRSNLVAVKKGVAVLRDRFTGADREVRAAVVVDAGHRLPDESTWQQVLDRTGRKVPRSGDAVAPRTIHEAILEGRRVAIDLG